MFAITSAVSVAAVYYVTISNSEHTRREVVECGGVYVDLGLTPDWLTKKIPAARILDPVVEIHCTNSEAIKFPESRAILRNRWIFGGEASISTELIEVLAKNDHLDYVHLDYTSLGDFYLETLSESDNITLLGISGTMCTDAGMKHLQKYRRLESLYVCQMPISDIGAAHIAKCQRLKYLNIYETSITSKGLEELAKLPCLDTLVVSDKKEFKKALTKLKLRNPRLNIVAFEPPKFEPMPLPSHSIRESF